MLGLLIRSLGFVLGGFGVVGVGGDDHGFLDNGGHGELVEVLLSEGFGHVELFHDFGSHFDFEEVGSEKLDDVAGVLDFLSVAVLVGAPADEGLVDLGLHELELLADDFGCLGTASSLQKSALSLAWRLMTSALHNLNGFGRCVRSKLLSS